MNEWWEVHRWCTDALEGSWRLLKVLESSWRLLNWDPEVFLEVIVRITCVTTCRFFWNFNTFDKSLSYKHPTNEVLACPWLFAWPRLFLPEIAWLARSFSWNYICWRNPEPRIGKTVKHVKPYHLQGDFRSRHGASQRQPPADFAVDLIPRYPKISQECKGGVRSPRQKDPSTIHGFRWKNCENCFCGIRMWQSGHDMSGLRNVYEMVKHV